MAGRLSFSIAINLLTENFRKGSNQVKAAFRSMQMQILTFAAALGAGGIGLSNMVTRFIDVARETNRVTTALKNVSGGMAQFAENQRFLLEMAKKYGLEINALTGNYAKFTAAASISGMSLMDQRKIFESVSRAVTAFGMSADDSNGVFLALSQMMSKGKISSEELRLQMGERLPVALQAMAKAAGTSVAGLDKLLKKGELMSADVLPKFADALNEMIPNVDVDNLETSVNRLKNAFTDFVNGADVQSKYKSLIDWLTGAIQGLGGNLKNILTLAFAAIAFAATRAATKVWSAWSAAYDNTAASGERASAQAIRATERRVAVEGTLAVKQKLEAAALSDYQIAMANGTSREVLAAEVAKDKSVRARIAAESSLEKARAAEQKALDKEKQISATASAMAGANGFKRAGIIIGAQAKRLMLTLKGLWSSFAPALIISAIVGIIGYFKNLRDEAERVRKIFSDYKRESESVTHTPEIIQLKVIQDLYNKAADGSKEKEKYQNRIIELLGGELKKNQDINDAVRERIKLMEASAKVDYHTRKKVEAEDQLRVMYDRRGGEKAFNFQYQNAKQNEGIVNFGGQAPIIQEMEEAVALRKVIEIADSNIRENTELLEKNRKTTPPAISTDLDNDPKRTPLQKAEEEYHSSLQKYKNQLDAGAITQEQYNKEIDKLNSDAVVKLGGILGKSADANETYASALKGTLNPLVTESAKAQAELSKVEAEYMKATDLARMKLDKKLITEDDYRKALVEAAIAAANSAISIENIGSAADKFIKEMQGVVGTNLKIETPKLGKRDTTFDYKKSKSDKLSEEVDIWVKYKDDLKDKLEEAKKVGSDTAKSLEIEFNNALAKVGNMEDALKLAQVQEDIKNLNKELSQSLYSGVKDIASSSDRIVNAFSNLRDVMNDVDASGWERIMAIWNAMTNVVDTFLSISKMIENITDLTNKLCKAKEAEEAIDTAVTATKVTNKATETSAELTALGVQTTAEVAASTAKSTAASVEMAAKSTAAYAAIPFAGVGLAAAQIGAMEALIAAAAIPKFAKGGIIGGGPSSGDKILARVNAGEMILNQGQQSRLFAAINSGKLGGSSGNLSSTVSTRVRAKDIILTINNELKSQGKKPIS